jgi:hypothetical protein
VSPPLVSSRTAAPRLAIALVVAHLALVTAARAEPKTDEAKRHFINGVHLFEDRNFASALVEFQASYELNPTAVALQNIAVCQKGLFRYADAIATLERMLREFGGQLSADDKKSAEDAIRDMNALLGSVLVKVDPPSARVSINDAPVEPALLAAPIRLAAGEYRIAAEAPGYERQEKVVTVSSGQKDAPVDLSLAKSAAPPPYEASKVPALAAPVRGFYGFLSFGGSSLEASAPDGIINEKPRTGGVYGILRGGYRLSTWIGLELQVVSSSHSITACRDTPAGCPSAAGNYHFTSTRVGPALRLTTSGASGRIFGSVSIGAAFHHLGYDPSLKTSDADGAGPYGELAGGYEHNLGHFMLGAAIRLLADDASKVTIKSSNSAGIEIGIGYSQW